MKKLNEVLYNKILLQAEEAKDKGMIKLANAAVGSLTAIPESEKITYSWNEMSDDVHKGLWKLATCVMKYHDAESVNIELVDEAMERLASKMVEEMEFILNRTGIGPLEPKVLGEE